jgi:SAM-dependent methyltransferase
VGVNGLIWQLRQGIAKHGPWKSFLIVMERLWRAAARRWRRREELRFDRDRGIDTTGIGELPADSERVRYQATMPETFLRLIRSLGIDTQLFRFIDLGCGKGRTLVLAQELGFRRITGVELDEGLTELARRNLGTAEIHHLDAGMYEFPPEPTVLYFYNPFMEDTMRKVMANLKRSLTTHPVYVVYYNPVLANLLDEQPFLERIHSERNAVIYHAPAPGSFEAR